MLNFQDLAKITVEAIHENKEEVAILPEHGKNKSLNLYSFQFIHRLQ